MRPSGRPSPAVPRHAPAAHPCRRGALSGLATAFRSVSQTVVHAVAALILAGCEMPTTERTAAQPTESSAVATASRRTVPAAGIAPRVADAVWSFQMGKALCAASAAHPALTLTITVRDGRLVEVVLRSAAGTRTAYRRGSSYLAFSGPTGSWRIPGRVGPDRAVRLSQSLDEAAASRVLMLLEGGTVEIAGGRGWPVLKLPPSGAAGRDWFECVRRQLLS